ncbi:hypothetical protein [Kitasatospora sp. A2-31]|uniref:hypothetical protein n=1 Tax=Kitasatospora sp. A2-31 TaxID=2916414 RepID=UPI001EEBB0CC|nr:hypothetical protein [Kitasatospora sp. A2-31]MCG6494823.1 hypothetical protein [Kitasatospora sp. A2-31]
MSTARPSRVLLRSAGLGLAVATAGVVGYLDWDHHRPAEQPGRAARLCGLPTGADTPLGRLLPPGAQDVEAREADGYGGPGAGARRCSIRVDGRTALTLSAVRREGSAALSDEAARWPDAHTFGAGVLSASWADGAAVADYCPGAPVAHVLLEVTAGEAARTSRPDLEQVAGEALAGQRKEVCG